MYARITQLSTLLYKFFCFFIKELTSVCLDIFYNSIVFEYYSECECGLEKLGFFLLIYSVTKIKKENEMAKSSRQPLVTVLDKSFIHNPCFDMIRLNDRLLCLIFLSKLTQLALCTGLLIFIIFHGVASRPAFFQ